MLAARGISVNYETVRQWVMKFGDAFSDQIRQRAPGCGCGARSIKMASFSTFWFSVEETAARRVSS